VKHTNALVIGRTIRKWIFRSVNDCSGFMWLACQE